MSSQPQKAACSEVNAPGNTAADRRALDELFNRLYDKIRRLASRIRWNGTNPTLNPTALVHEAYIKLLKDPPDLASKSYEEAIAVFANAMRQILVDAARRKGAQKRAPVDLPDKANLPIEDALTLDMVLEELERENPLQARIVQCRFLLGMTVDETAATLSISKTTVEREWRETKVRLSRKVHPAPDKE